MVQYKIFFKPSAERQLRKLPTEVQRRIVRDVATLALNPRQPGVIKLAGAESLWRMRTGDYRVVYEIHDDLLVVLVLCVAHRKDVYRGE